MQDSLIVVALVGLVAVMEYDNEEEHHLCNYMKYMIARCKA